MESIPHRSTQEHEEIRSVIDAAGSPLNDLSTTPPDIFAYLADRQVYRHMINETCFEVDKNWPHVVSLESGIHNRHPYIALRISPYNEENAKRHNDLIRRLRNLFPVYSDITFYCLGEDKPDAVSAATEIYKRVT